jgi:predicted DNA-binding antitoxin AbrB/MazE fold protein
MPTTITAIYEAGAFKPDEPICMNEGERVTLTIERAEPAPARPLDGWVGTLSNEDAAEMLRIIEEEFGYKSRYGV